MLDRTFLDHVQDLNICSESSRQEDGIRTGSGCRRSEVGGKENTFEEEPNTLNNGYLRTNRDDRPFG